MFENITRDFLESILTKDTNVSRAVKIIKEKASKNLLENTELYGKIEEFIPLYSNYLNNYINNEIKIESENIMEIQNMIVNHFKKNGFNVFILNSHDYQEKTLVITNKNSFKNTVSERYMKGEKVVFKDGKIL